MNSATLLPAFSINTALGIPYRSVVRRSTSRVSAAVRIFTVGDSSKTQIPSENTSWGTAFAVNALPASQHPAAADVQHLSCNEIRAVGGKELYSRGNIFSRRRPPYRRARVVHAARFLRGQFPLINVGRIDDVDRNSVFGFLHRERSRKRNDGGFRCRVRRNRPLAKTAFRAQSAQVDNAPPVMAPHLRQRRFARIENAEEV